MSQHQQPPLIQPNPVLYTYTANILTYSYTMSCYSNHIMSYDTTYSCDMYNKPIIPNSTQHIPCVILL